jgi:hypothetical protein
VFNLPSEVTIADDRILRLLHNEQASLDVVMSATEETAEAKMYVQYVVSDYLLPEC